jgi:cobalt/nickel transport system permease protein
VPCGGGEGAPTTELTVRASKTEKTMHIPDGFIAPKMYVPAYVAAAGLWSYALKRVRAELDEEALPRIAVMTAFCFVLMMIMLPLPGGTSAHAAGVGLLAVLFGVWICFLCISMVLLLQALLFGIGGVTSLPINAIAMGLAGGAAAVYSFRLLRRVNQRVGLFVAGWLSIMVAAFLVALALGVQPQIAHRADGTPLFFPFGLSITIPALMIPHAIIGIGEGLLTVLVYEFMGRLKRKERG